MAVSSSAQDYMEKQYITLFSVALSRFSETDSCLLPKPFTKTLAIIWRL
jgi:hypothetical protein